MKPILFAADATTFTSNGKGVLDPTSCIVTEERNGQYELECEVPVESPHFADIANNMILAVVPGDGFSVHAVADRQAFRIYHISKPLNGLVTINARHLSYDLSYNTVMPFTADGILTAFSGMTSHMVETNRFSFNTDKSTSANFKVTVPQTARQLLGGQSGSILDVYGGEYQWDNWTVNIWNQRGSDTDVTLRYGKNITDLEQEENLENVITGIVPFWANEDETLTLPEISIDSQYASSYPYKRTIPVDFSSDWEEKPTVSQLRSRAQSYVTANRIGLPKISIKVSFVALWQTDEYKDVAPLERVHLCDTVGVVFEKYGINTRAEVIKTEWDCLAERYLSIELGEARSNFAKTIVDMNEETSAEIVEAKSDMQKAIDAATAAITGVNGGYIKINSTADGKPYEILIMDNEDATQARTVWRYNLAGWGVSTNGINGPYALAATLNSTYGASINADFIIVGTMLANRIKGGTLTLGGTEGNKGDGSIDIYDANNNKIATIDKNGFTYGNNNFKVDASGNLTMKQGSIQLGIPGNGSFWVSNGIATFDSAILSDIYIPGATDCDFYFGENGLDIRDVDSDHAKGRLGGGSDGAGHTGVVLMTSTGNDLFIQSSDALRLTGTDGIYLSGALHPTSSTTGQNGSYTARDKTKLTFNRGVLTSIDTSEQISTTGGTLSLKVGQKLTFERGLLTVVDTSESTSGWSGTLNGIGDSSGNYYCDIYVSKGLITGWSGWSHV